MRIAMDETVLVERLAARVVDPRRPTSVIGACPPAFVLSSHTLDSRARLGLPADLHVREGCREGADSALAWNGRKAEVPVMPTTPPVRSCNILSQPLTSRTPRKLSACGLILSGLASALRLRS